MHACKLELPHPGHRPRASPGSARPGVGITPSFTADGVVPGCTLHSEARVMPDPPCARATTRCTGVDRQVQVGPGRLRSQSGNRDSRALRVNKIVELSGAPQAALRAPPRGGQHRPAPPNARASPPWPFGCASDNALAAQAAQRQRDDATVTRSEGSVGRAPAECGWVARTTLSGGACWLRS